ncbi:MAG TPA: hypothetical protein VFA32_18855 [Dehalococcoidia bacterium]|nr:hypothetical protein [Dehalococcoidia bacterium]
MPRGKQRNQAWEELTTEQQEALLDLQEAAAEIRDQYEEELTRLEQQAAQGRMQARWDTAGITRQPVPPVPDVKRDAGYENLVLDTHRLVTYLAYLEASAAHLNVRGYDIGMGLAEYLHARTEAVAEGRVKAYAKTLEEEGRSAYATLHSRAVNLFPERAMQRLVEWDETSKQQDSWSERLRRMLGEP